MGKKNITITLDDEILEEIDEEAKKQDRSKSNLIRQIITNYFEHKEDNND